MFKSRKPLSTRLAVPFLGPALGAAAIATLSATGFAFAGTTASTPKPAQAAPTSGVEARWNEFQTNPVAFMNKQPIKKAVKGISTLPSFSAGDLLSMEYIDKKTGARAVTTCDLNGVCLKDVLEGRAAAQEDAASFFEKKELHGKKMLLTLEDMEKKKLKSAALKETPWSDTYWPIYQGILGARYSTKKFKADTSWKTYYDYVSQNGETLKAIADKGSPLALESLSPSEKYDLLIGDLSNGANFYTAGYLTPTMWQEGEQYWNEKKEVEKWMGICHGWAPAAYMMPRPTKAVEVGSANGDLKLKFYPSDMKGLSSYLWAKADMPSRYIGGRCNVKKPKTDANSGRVLDEECFDVNPSNWHQVIVNQIGVAKRSFVMDATYDYEVWNQPVFSYSYSYFNPQTGKSASTLAAATVEAANFTKDKFKKFRSKDAVSYVGVEMEVVYVVETEASHAEKDSADSDATQSVTYMYDIELDADGNMIGGEWYSNKHPDFMWTPAADARATSPGDAHIKGSWDTSKPLPKFWRDLAVATAVRTGMPVAAIIENLLEESNK